MSGLSKHQKKWRDRRLNEHPFCDQCGCRLIHPSFVFKKVPGRNGELYNRLMAKKVPDNMATYEHDHSRLNPKRWTTNGLTAKKKSLLCNKCNFENSQKEHQALSREFLNKLSEMEGKTRAERRAKIRVMLGVEFKDLT